ncbi:MAG TPA: ABC transporter permease [Anaerolineae bacterium]|jgi:simple sugar transport system permease protein|nr:ABC transporter permease [Anaerolineae bacterium]
MSSQSEDLALAEEGNGSRQGFSLSRFMRQRSTQLGIIAVFILIWAFFIIAAPDTFLSRQIYLAFMSTTPFFGITALVLTILIIAGEIDLSFPSIMAMGMVAYIFIFDATGSVFLAVSIGLILGFAIGLLNGALVVKIGIPSLVATIGTQFFWRGAVLVLLDGKGASLVEARETFTYNMLVGKTFGYIPNQFIWMVLVGIACWLLLNRTRLGAHAYLIGDNENSARLMGVNVGRTKALLFALVGLAAAFSGILASMHVSYFWPSLGEGYLLQTLSSVFLGGTSVFGGTGTILGTFLGAYIIGAIQAAVVAIGMTGFWTELIYGFIIIVSVSMHTILRRRAE